MRWDDVATDWDFAYAGLDSSATYIGIELVRTLGATRAQRHAVIDVGCGVGFALGCLQTQGVTAIGIDISSAMLARARKRAPTAKLCQADVHQLPFADDCFSAAILSSVLNFCRDPATVVAEVARVTRPGGIILFENHVPKRQTAIKHFNGDLGEIYAPGIGIHQCFDLAVQQGILKLPDSLATQVPPDNVQLFRVGGNGHT